jgi:hypothetical protein
MIGGKLERGEIGAIKYTFVFVYSLFQNLELVLK